MCVPPNAIDRVVKRLAILDLKSGDASVIPFRSFRAVALPEHGRTDPLKVISSHRKEFLKARYEHLRPRVPPFLP
jgi:hypothetical protein